MSKPVIEVHDLSKRYQLGRVGATRLKDDLRRFLSRIMHRRTDLEPGADDFWALDRVSFDLQAGEVLGIVGRNGAGKSTLLKILSRITEPTAGEAVIRGRIASLLEVGTGFHPELSGRENVYLNGAILGMSRAEIAGRFDEIVHFAEVERFLDTPVKRYSSGMYVRLAFAVAAHLPAEILVIDEVLAVGDVRFQGRCMDKMEAIARQEGRAVLFVSHQLNSVRRLCTRALLLDHGRVIATGDPSEITAAFQASMRPSSAQSADGVPGDGSKCCFVKRIRLEDDRGRETSDVSLGAPCVFKLWISAQRPVRIPELSLEVTDGFGDSITHISSKDGGYSELKLKAGEQRAFAIRVPAVWWRPGHYEVSLWMAEDDGGVLHDWRCAMEFNVDNGTVLRRHGFPSHTRMFTDSEWSVIDETAEIIG